MPSPPPEQQQLRSLLDDDEYEFSQRASRQAKVDLKDHFGRDPSDGEVVQYIIDALGPGGVCLVPVAQCTPPDPNDIAWQATDRRGIFIKLKVYEYRLGKYRAYIQSCHRTNYPR
ncbi:MAG: hypothetical protein K8U57_27465 [Planctomycetes bacterium]|nr:hypothetical protein [Planctomycetota bacterium]